MGEPSTSPIDSRGASFGKPSAVNVTPSWSAIFATDSGDRALGTFGSATSAGEGLGNGEGDGLGRTTLGGRVTVGFGEGVATGAAATVTIPDVALIEFEAAESPIEFTAFRVIG